MQSKTTLKRIGGFLKKSLVILGLFCFVAGKIDAQVYINGNLSTGATASTGDAAPAGFTWSEVQPGNGNAGYAASIANGFTVADDFTILCGTWDITKFTFYAYSTGYAGTTSPFTDLRLQIYDTDPSAGGVTPVFGNLTANVLSASSTANMYRIFEAAPATNRQIWKIEANVAVSLTAGHYWVEWQVENGLASNFSPASTVLGATTVPGYNAIQHTLADDSWAPLLDGPSGNDPQDMPFRIDYNTTVCSGTPVPGNTIASVTEACPGNPFTLNPENPTCGSGVTYQWQSSPDNTTYTDIPGANNYSLITTLTASTWYQLVATCTASASSGTSTPVQVTLAPASSCYCIPDVSDCSDGDIITNVTLNTLNNTSDCSPTGFTNYSGDAGVAVPDIVQGVNNPISVTAGGGLFDETVAVWIDYDHSGTFDANEFTFVGGTTGGTLTQNIAVPATAPLGNARMRVRVNFFDPLGAGDACTASTLGFGETEDYVVNIIPCVQGVFDVQPVNTTVVCGNSAIFSSSVSGTYITYQWQEKVSASAPWTNVVDGGNYSGATTNTLSLGQVDGSMSGYLYRVLISGGCTAIDFSDIVTLTVSPLVIEVSPASYSTCSPIPATSPVELSISTVAGGSITTTTSYPSSATLNLSIPDIGDPTGVTNSITVPPLPAGAVVTGVSVVLNATHTWVGDLIFALKAPNGNTLNLDYGLGGTGGADPSTGFTNTEISSSAPAANTLDLGSDPFTGLFAPDAIPDPGPGFFPAAATSLAVTPPDPIVTSFSDLYSVPAGVWTLGVYDYFAGDFGTLNNWTLKLTYTVTSSDPFAGVWTPADGLFLDAAGTIPYDGSTQTTVYAAPTSSTVYTVTVDNATCPAAPTEVPVTILKADPTVTISVNPYTSLYPGLRTLLTAKVDPSSPSTETFEWYHNGQLIPGATSSTYEVSFANTGLGDYHVEVIDPTVCSGRIVTADVTIKDSVSNTLFIWPNPSSGQFQVRYNDAEHDIRSGAPYLNVYDSKGARVFSRSFNITEPYGRMDVDLSSKSKGTYIVVLYSADGKLLQSGRVVIQ